MNVIKSTTGLEKPRCKESGWKLNESFFLFKQIYNIYCCYLFITDI